MRFFWVKIGNDQGKYNQIPYPVLKNKNKKKEDLYSLHKTAIAAMQGLSSLVRFGNKVRPFP